MCDANLTPVDLKRFESIFVLHHGLFNRKSRVRPRPRDVRGRTVSRRHRAIEQSQVDCQLRPMVRTVQDAPPEYPDSLAPHIEELYLLEPLLFRTTGEPWKPGFRQFGEPPGESLNRPADGKHGRCGRFGIAQKLGEEPALRQKLMGHNLANCA